ncbi:hypothetical protein [Gemmobacter sp. 24YEA27]|uniref:hypothetical protein n=1 Tax=Gemmobacter sp. 24YEA27 TaxID=3040672 RepID=UPI0024B3B481|nr:hypothetical protein [Gemmobacter sp. 24YEA27]
MKNQIFIAHEVPEETIEELLESGDVQAFVSLLQPLEKHIQIFADGKTGALYCECHVMAGTLVAHTTPDTPLDPDASPDYRANRDLVEDHAAYTQMLLDAQQGRTFSNIVCEFIAGDAKPLKVVGGQHRFGAIESAYKDGNVNGIHGVKVYFALDTEQRLDVQVISNTNIEVSRDLLDRMFETVNGAELRAWCQKVGFLGKKEDFADKRKRGGTISVRQARTFVINHFLGREKKDLEFDQTETVPHVAKTGVRIVPEWERIKKQYPELWNDPVLEKAGKEFQALVDKQRKAFVKTGSTKTSNPDFAEKAMNEAVLAAWSFVTGILSGNPVRLQKHFDLKDKGKPDPLRAALLIKGRHMTDPEQYRGLGYRTDPKERGRFVELFWIQAEKGGGFSDKMISAAIAAYHAKTAILDAKAKKEAI